MKIDIKADFTGQMIKMDTLRNAPAAFKRNATDWASETVRYIQQSIRGGRVFKQAPKEIEQRLGMKVVTTGDSGQITIGTGGYIGKEEVVYARIQEEGGWIFPKKGKFLAIPLAGSHGSPRNYPGIFFLRTMTGNLLACEKTGKTGRTWKARFELVKSVKLPARHWFTIPIAERMPDLERAMSPEGVWATAEQMAYKRTPEQGGNA